MRIEFLTRNIIGLVSVVDVTFIFYIKRKYTLIWILYRVSVLTDNWLQRGGGASTSSAVNLHSRHSACTVSNTVYFLREYRVKTLKVFSLLNINIIPRMRIKKGDGYCFVFAKDRHPSSREGRSSDDELQIFFYL